MNALYQRELVHYVTIFLSESAMVRSALCVYMYIRSRCLWCTDADGDALISRGTVVIEVRADITEMVQTPSTDKQQLMARCMRHSLRLFTKCTRLLGGMERYAQWYGFVIMAV